MDSIVNAWVHLLSCKSLGYYTEYTEMCMNRTVKPSVTTQCHALFPAKPFLFTEICFD